MAAPRPDAAYAGGARGGGERGRTGRAKGVHGGGQIFRAQAAVASPVSGSPAARARRHRRAADLPVLRFGTAVEARRGYDRDAGGDPAPLEGDPDRARALQLPRLRDDHAAYSGYNRLYDAGRPQGAITPAFCWAHARRQFFELADIAANPRRGKNAVVISRIALEAVRRIDALFEIERLINGRSAAERLHVRREQSAPLVADLEVWLRDQRSRLSRSASVAEPIDYMLRRWPSFARFLDDGRICLSNNAAERALRGFALGRRSWLFAGSERGADRAAAIATLIMTAKL